jgi:hypothetical protein
MWINFVIFTYQNQKMDSILNNIAVLSGFQNWKHLEQNSCITTPQVKKAMIVYADQLAGDNTVLKISLRGMKNTVKEQNNHIRNLLTVIFTNNLVDQKTYDKAISDLDKELIYNDIK